MYLKIDKKTIKRMEIKGGMTEGKDGRRDRGRKGGRELSGREGCRIVRRKVGREGGRQRRMEGEMEEARERERWWRKRGGGRVEGKGRDEGEREG